jgi:hypothetical protein
MLAATCAKEANDAYHINSYLSKNDNLKRKEEGKKKE